MERLYLLPVGSIQVTVVLMGVLLVVVPVTVGDFATISSSDCAYPQALLPLSAFGDDTIASFRLCRSSLATANDLIQSAA